MDDVPDNVAVPGCGRRPPDLLGRICRFERAVVRMACVLAVASALVVAVDQGGRWDQAAWGHLVLLEQAVGVLCALASAVALVILVASGLRFGVVRSSSLYLALAALVVGTCVACAAARLPRLVPKY